MFAVGPVTAPEEEGALPMGGAKLHRVLAHILGRVLLLRLLVCYHIAEIIVIVNLVGGLVGCP